MTWKAALEGNPYRPQGWLEVEAMPEPQWVIEGTLPERALAVIYGPPGSYKSFLALDMVARASIGKPWAGMATHECVATYVAGEGKYGFRRRRAALAESLEQSRFEHVYYVGSMPQLLERFDVAQFVKARVEKPKVVVIDTLASASAGADENTAKDASLVIARCQELIDTLNCTVVLIHHSGKDVTRGMRGSTVLTASADVVLRVESPEKGQAVVRMEKMKDSEPWQEPKGFQMNRLSGSLVPEYTSTALLRVTLQDTRARAVIKLIGDAPEEVWSSAAIVHELAKEETSKDWAAWLKHDAPNREDLMPYCKGAGEWGAKL